MNNGMYLGMRRILLAGGAALSLVGMTVIPASASATKSSASATKSVKSCHSANGVKITDPLVCKGLAFYKGKTMNFISPGSVGGPFDLQVEGEIPSMQAFLGATINETRITTGNTITGQDALAAAAPDGLTIGLLNSLEDAVLILEHQPGINFNPYRMAYLSGTNALPMVLMALPNKGYKTFADWMAAAKRGSLKMVTQATGSENTVFRTVAAATGGITSANSPAWVSGYTKLTDEITGFLRDDAPVGYLNLSNTCNILQSKQAVPLAINEIPAVGTSCRNLLVHVPTFADIATKYAKTSAQKTLFATAQAMNALTGNPTVTQTSVSGYKIAALRAALQWTYKQPSFKQLMLNNGIGSEYIDPIAAKQLYETAVKFGKTVVCYINSADACAKA